jgi:hypothetical protein
MADGKLDLAGVTLCAIDCAMPQLAARALERSLALCDFADAVLFTDTSVPGRFRTVAIDRLASKDDYSRFVFRDLVRFVETPFVLIVQWDGYVLEPTAWDPAFLNFDYVGAKWPWYKDGMTVGNGGFSLRSHRLLEALANGHYPLASGFSEDDLICRLYRKRLAAEAGILFAPESVADAFSYERSLPAAPTFGFHGLFNMWRHVEDAEMVALAAKFAPHLFATREFFEITLQYFLLRKFGPLECLYRRFCALYAPKDMRRMMLAAIRNERLVDDFLSVCGRAFPERPTGRA